MSSLGLGCPAATDLTLVAVPDSFGDPVDRPFGALFPIVAETLTGWIFVATVIRFDGGSAWVATHSTILASAFVGTLNKSKRIFPDTMPIDNNPCAFVHQSTEREREKK